MNIMERTAHISRKTNETNIELSLNIDGTGLADISTGIGFFDINLNVQGDLRVDSHHTVEDTGICLGMALSQALSDKAGVTRYGSAVVPMDEVLVLCAVDLSGRAYLNFDAAFGSEKLGDMEAETVEEFFRAVSQTGGMNVHFKLLAGKNCHHIAEGLFKAFARALDMACGLDSRVAGVPSTKGVL